MSFKQLDPPLPLETPHGRGLAHLVLDYGVEFHLIWIVFLDKDGSCWSVPNPDIRLQSNWTMGRTAGTAGAVNSPSKRRPRR
jgi:hypothetical protein